MKAVKGLVELKDYLAFQQPLITTIYLQNTTSVVANTTLLLLELLFSVHIVIYTLYRFALIQLSLKYYLACHRNSEIRLRYSDNNNLLYRHETSN